MPEAEANNAKVLEIHDFDMVKVLKRYKDTILSNRVITKTT